MSNQDTTETFVQEVDQQVREERLMATLKRFAPWLASAFVLLLVAVGGWEFWKGYERSQARTQTEQFVAAQLLLERGDVNGAKAAFERLMNQGPARYRAMARMEHAAVLVNEGDLEGAIADFDRAAADAPDAIMKESAQLRAAYIAADTQDFAALQSRLQPLLQSHSRLSYYARELLAVQAWRTGHTDVARSTLEEITLAFDAPEDVRQRSQIALSLVGRAPQQAPAAGAPAQTPSTPHGAATTP